MKKMMVAALFLSLNLLAACRTASPAAGPASSSRVAAGGYHTCVLTNEGGVLCWGWNSFGQLGNGATTRSSTIPVEVTGLSNGVAAIAAGERHTCAVKADRSVWCWGDNSGRQLGIGTTSDRSRTPLEVPNLTSVAAVTAGQAHTCARKTNGHVWCWGWNEHRQVGIDTPDSLLSAPVEVPNLTSVAAVTAGQAHTCALKTDGSVWCWGANLYGQLGHGTTVDSVTPVEVPNLTSVKAIAAGYLHTCALKTDGGVACWGSNLAGQLGSDTPNNMSGIPVEVPNLWSNVSAIAAGGGHTCARKTNGHVWCWGWNNYGQVGNGTASKEPDDQLNISDISSNVSAIAAGGGHTCALKVDGNFWCWGNNGEGQLGIGTSGGWQTTPVKTSNL